jgi:hypothetical protein
LMCNPCRLVLWRKWTNMRQFILYYYPGWTIAHLYLELSAADDDSLLLPAVPILHGG